MARKRRKDKELYPDDLNPEHYLYDYDYNIGKKQQEEIDVINRLQLKTGHVYTNAKGEQRRIMMIKVVEGARMFYTTDMRHEGVPVFVTPRSGFPECKIAYRDHPGGPKTVQAECDPSEFAEWLGEPDGVECDPDTGWPSEDFKAHGQGYQKRLAKSAEKMLEKSADTLKGKEVWEPLSAEDSISDDAYEKTKEAAKKKKSGGKSAKKKGRRKAK